MHEAEADQLPPLPAPAHRFEVTLEPDDFTQEKYEVYLAYQMSVHKELESKNKPDQFRRFLCESPLERKDHTVDGELRAMGSFHQCYRLDGRLVAIGVLDLLPQCVSGVYFAYHPDFSKHSLGKVSALREAAMALEGGYAYYYMGYYIHSCPKMQYKNNYGPQEFLDLGSMAWLPLDDNARRLMSENHFVTGEVVRRAAEEGEGYERSRKSEVAVTELEAMYPGVRLAGLGLLGMMSEEEVYEVDPDTVTVELQEMTILGSVCFRFGRALANGVADSADVGRGD